MRAIISSFPRAASLAATVSLTAALLLLFAGPAWAGDWYVATDGSDANDGTQRAPFATIARAVDMAAWDDTVHLAAGTYLPTSRIVVDRQITIVGAGRADTIIDGTQNFVLFTTGVWENGRLVERTLPYGRGCFMIQNHVVLRDLTMQNCKMEDPYAHEEDRVGGAIEAVYPLTVERCGFVNCSATYGGAIASLVDLNLADCSFEGCSAKIGGAVCSLLYRNHATIAATGCRFAGNRAKTADGRGAAIGVWPAAYSPQVGSTIDLARCHFEANAAGPSRLGMILAWGSDLTATDCTFVGNTQGPVVSTARLGWVSPIAASARVERCRFYGNDGGVAGYHADLDIRDSAFVGNKGCVLAEGDHPARVTNCTLDSTNGAPALSVSLYSTMGVANCIVTRSTAGNVATDRVGEGAVVISNSNVQGWTPSVYVVDGGGNLGDETGPVGKDPTFVRAPSPGVDGVWGTEDDDYGDLRLAPGSPCIDAGTNALVPADLAVDILGLPRLLDDPLTVDVGSPPPVVDMGAYEFFSMQTLIRGVELAMVGGSALPADGQPLFTQLNNARTCLDAGDSEGAIRSLTIFSQQVSGLARAGKLTQAQADGLLAQAQALIAQLGG